PHPQSVAAEGAGQALGGKALDLHVSLSGGDPHHIPHREVFGVGGIDGGGAVGGNQLDGGAGVGVAVGVGAGGGLHRRHHADHLGLGLTGIPHGSHAAAAAQQQ